MSDSPTTFYLTQGVLGVSVLVLAMVIGILYNRNQKLQDKITDLITMLQESRITDLKQANTSMVEPLRSVQQTLDSLLILIKSMGRNG